MHTCQGRTKLWVLAGLVLGAIVALMGTRLWLPRAAVVSMVAAYEPNPKHVHAVVWRDEHATPVHMRRGDWQETQLHVFTITPTVNGNLGELGMGEAGMGEAGMGEVGMGEVGMGEVGMGEVRILGASTVNGPVNIMRWVETNPGWEIDRDGSIVTVCAAPLRMHLDTQFVTIHFAAGPCAIDATIRHNGEERAIALHADEVGSLPQTFGERLVLRSVDVSCERGPVRVSLVREPASPVRIQRAWSTTGNVRIAKGEAGDSVMFMPPEPAALHPAFLAGGLVALYFTCVPMIAGVARRVKSERGQVLVIAAWWSLGYAALLTLIFFPGIVTPDGLQRVTTAWGLDHPERVPAHLMIADWFPPALMLSMNTLHDVLGGWWPMPLMQAWFFSASLAALMITCAGPRWGMRLWAIVLLLPPVWSHAIAHLADAWAAGALCLIAAALAWCFGRARASLSTFEGAWFTAAIAVGSIVLFTLRSNSLTVAPVLIVALLWVVRSRVRAGVAIAFVCGACVLSRALPELTMLRRVDTPAASMVWEHAGMLSIAGDSHLNGLNNLEFTARGGGATEKAIELYRAWPYTHDVLLFGSDTPLDFEAVRAPSGEVKKHFVQFVREQPALYARMKLEHAKVMLGLKGYVPVLTVGPMAPTQELPAHEGGATLAYESHYGTDVRTTSLLGTIQRDLSRAAGTASEAASVVFRPWLSLMVSGGLWLVAIVRRRATRTLTMTMLLALSYFGAFFVLSPGLNFRYFLPSMCLCVGAIAHAGMLLRAKRADADSHDGVTSELRRAA